MRRDLDKRKDEILDWISQDVTKAEICRRLVCQPDTLNRWLKRNSITYKGHQNQKGVYKGKGKKSFAEYIKSTHIKSHLLKKKMLEEKIKPHKCESCGRKTWLKKPIPLELHHVDGNHYNNDLSNLQLLCPNCHAQTDNYRGKNKS